MIGERVRVGFSAGDSNFSHWGLLLMWSWSRARSWSVTSWSPNFSEDQLMHAKYEVLPWYGVVAWRICTS
ncbi:hypothetical protein TNCV_1048701 [Trichonephila clavipes]|nr:hypothetical protein TNCV_1048701 [Trichonephila clavipes]